MVSYLKKILRVWFPSNDEIFRMRRKRIIDKIINFVIKHIDLKDIKTVESFYYGSPNQEVLVYFSNLKSLPDAFYFHESHDFDIIGVSTVDEKLYLLLDCVDQSYDRRLGYFHEVKTLPKFITERCKKYPQESVFDTYKYPNYLQERIHNESRSE